MRTMMYRMTPVFLVTVWLGCSSHSAQISHNDGGKVSEAGSIDGIDDGARRLDARDASRLDLSTTEAGAARDTKDAGTDTQVRDSRDAAGEGAAPDTSASRDTSLDGKRDGNLDVFEQPDGPLDTGPILGTCAAPFDIPYGVLHADLKVNTASALHIVDFPCANNGGDIVFRILSSQAELAYADTFGATWNTALFFTDTCDGVNPPDGTDMVTCNDDACGTSQSQAFATLAYGYHYLIVSGVNGDAGDVTVHFQHAPIGNGPLVALPPGPGTVSGTTDGIDPSRTCDTSGPKNSYWWVYCPSDLGGSFHASTCNGADWDTALVFQVPSVEDVLCDDDDMSCGMQSTIDTTITPGAGIFVVSVAGTLLSSYGDYTLTYIRP